MRIAIQNNGRLSIDSISYLKGLGIDAAPDAKNPLRKKTNNGLELIYVRPKDIPNLVRHHFCDFGIVGEDSVYEQLGYRTSGVTIVDRLNFSHCRLSIAAPYKVNSFRLRHLSGKRIVTRYKRILQHHLKENAVNASIIDMSGSIEIAPYIGMSDYIFDIVDTGKTLKQNNLHELITILESQAVLIKSKKCDVNLM